MSDFRTILIEDSRIADITATEAFGVQSGPAQNTYQRFQAVSASNSSIVYNVQIPSENIVIDRHVLMRTQLAFQVLIEPAVPIAADTCVFDYGVTDCLQAFPLNSLFTTIQSTINNVSISTNLKDVLPMITKMYDRRVLSRLNSTTPAYVDNIYGNYKDTLVVPPAGGLAATTGITANNSPLAGVKTNGYDEDFFPRGAYELDAIVIDHYQGAGPNAWDHLPIALGNAGEKWVISIKVTIAEPFLALSPYLNTEPDNDAGLLGVNNLSLVCNIDNECKRLFSTAAQDAPGANSFSPYITSINLGWNNPGAGAITTQPVGFAAPSLLFNFLSLQPEQYSKISTKNVVPFVDVPRYLTTSTNASAIAGYTPVYNAATGVLNDPATQIISSQSIQLNQVPDLILICARVPMAEQNWAYPSGFLTIKNISINFNNASGLLSTATEQNLYEMSVRNGSAQSWNEFRGLVSSSLTLQPGVLAPTGLPSVVPSTGSLLVLNPVMDFSLPSYLSASSLGQYQLQFNVTIANQLPFQVQPELCIITMNSGVFVTQQGTSQIFTGILTKEQVLNTKEKNPVPHLATNEYKRLIGGKLSNRGMGSLMKMVRDMPKLHHHLMAKVEGAGSSGGGTSGGMSGGSISGKGKGSKSLSKLAKHFA